MIFYKDKKHQFFEIFNEDNGALLRSNLIIDNIESTIPAHIRSFPELIDVGIMGNCHVAKTNLCKNFGVDCYQNGHSAHRENLTLEKYKIILEQCRRRVFQIVLGGAGDPIKHENFESILKLTRQEDIVPNLTTTGFGLTEREAQLINDYCGAVAVSYYSRLDKFRNETNDISSNAIKKLIKSGCKVNIHYVLSKATIKDAILRLTHNLFPANVSAVIFLLYKAIGEGKHEKVLDPLSQDYRNLMNIIQNKKWGFKIGFDTCQAPALRKFCTNLSEASIESCESARFSMYIGSDFKAYPCSFACLDKNFDLDLDRLSIQQAWDSQDFALFRGKQLTMCPQCNTKDCYGCALDAVPTVCNG